MCAPGGAGVVPLEFTTVDEQHYASALRRLTATPAFVSEYAAALGALSLTELVGLTILPPTHVCKARA
jgi:threonine dehydratase